MTRPAHNRWDHRRIFTIYSDSIKAVSRNSVYDKYGERNGMFLFKRDNDSFQHIDAATYNDEYHSSKADHMLVDVRTAEEYASGHLPGAINIPLHQLPTRITEVPAGKPVVVVCASGNRSQNGANILARSGYVEVYNLRGGTMAWAMQGLPLES